MASSPDAEGDPVARLAESTCVGAIYARANEALSSSNSARLIGGLSVTARHSVLSEQAQGSGVQQSATKARPSRDQEREIGMSKVSLYA